MTGYGKRPGFYRRRLRGLIPESWLGCLGSILREKGINDEVQAKEY
jgi:hypothetical protein